MKAVVIREPGAPEVKYDGAGQRTKLIDPDLGETLYS